MHQRKTAQNKTFLVNLKLKGGHTIVDHLCDFQDIVNQLSTLELALCEELRALFLLSSFLESWETPVAIVSNSIPGDKLSLSAVINCLFNEEPVERRCALISTRLLSLKGEVEVRVEDQREKKKVTTDPNVR